MNRLLQIGILLLVFTAYGQQERVTYWQQHVDYKMEVQMVVESFQYTGTQHLLYTNNSKDTLNKVYFHLYNNAFQPGSEMDIRLQHVHDPDDRMVHVIKNGEQEEKISKIKTLKPDEVGYLKIPFILQGKDTLKTKLSGTVLEVDLKTPIQPNTTTVFYLEFEGQVPTQIRRSGRNNKEGVALSMTQWYPKMAVYDFEGWHTDPYIGREFHGEFGNFDVKITIDKDYILGGSGYLQNANEIGYGYQDEGVAIKHKRRTKQLTWHFYAPKVHDFTWAADPDYLHDKVQVENGPVLHFLYKNNKEIIENWQKLQPKAVRLMQFYNSLIGDYPYDQYSIIQGGDGGMEYAMCTLITGERKFGSLVGVTAHEMAHSWFQHVLATNEAKHPWMDEGFTSYVSELAMDEVMEKEEPTTFSSAYKNYFYLIEKTTEQPLTTHADRYLDNLSYGINAYSKGTIFLSQLAYLIGQENLVKTLREYYKQFQFTHPTPNDFKRIAEKVSGAHLDWYLTDWTKTTNTIDYNIKEVKEEGEQTKVVLERIGNMPMPLDIFVVYEDHSQESFHIPLRMMRYVKENPYPKVKRTVLEDWPWAFPTYSFEIPKPKKEILAIIIDPTMQMADTNKDNNIYQLTNN
ncbi:MAG: M1 family metallopeptidase [Flavobacteriales bacterium]|nr:M1 family metallopeptidase [Flavobacteriales bacterium]